MEPDPIPTDNRPDWLRALMEKSWNLELIISGAAIFLANYLPNAVDNMLRYYLENLVMDEDFRKITLPILVYSFMKVVAWLLILTFVAHFVMRAFWAGVVGLHTVYTEGIQYEKLPWQTSFTQEQMRQRFGLLSDFILRLDRLCNLVFSIAFLIALLSIGICMAYVFLFLAINVLPVFVGESLGTKISYGLMGFYMLLAFLPALTQLAMRVPRLAKLTWMQRLTAWAVRNVGNFLMPMIYKPMTYLNLTFTSQVPKKRLLGILFFGMVVIMGGVLLNATSTMRHLAGQTDFNTRDFFAKSRGSHLFTGSFYDNIRSPEDRLPPVSIPTETPEGSFLRVFVDYPKLLDAALLKRCALPVLPDSMPKHLKRTVIDSVQIACMTSFFRLTLNDSLIAQPDWMFYVHPIVGSPGVVAYLPTANFKKGKNVLRVQVPSSQNPDSLRVYGQVPFWFAPQ